MHVVPPVPAVQVALVAINAALDEGDADTTLETLLNEHLDLTDVNPDNKEYYYKGLKEIKQRKQVVNRTASCTTSY